MHAVTLLEVFRNLVKELGDNLTSPLNIVLERDFKLRISSDYGKPCPVERDSLTPQHWEGCFVPPEDIVMDEGGNISAAKPHKPGIKDISKSIFRYKNAPESSFILPEGDLRGKDLIAILSQRDKELVDDEDINSESSDKVEEALMALEHSVMSEGGAGGEVEAIADVPHNIKHPDRRKSGINSTVIGSPLSTPFTRELPEPKIPPLYVPDSPIPTPSSSPDSERGAEDTLVSDTVIENTEAIDQDLPKENSPSSDSNTNGEDKGTDMSTVTKTRPEGGKTKEEESDDVYPHKYSAFCSFCYGRRMYLRGKCFRCSLPYKYVMSHLMKGARCDAERFYPYFPKEYLN